MRNRYGNKRHARILVVDDEQTLVLTLGEILVEQGYEVATAFSGEDAIARASGFFPDLLVSDVCMGEVNGVEAATAITEMLPGCRVLFVSGLASISDLMRAAPERLIYSFIPKPIQWLDLINAIAYMLPPASVALVPAAKSLDRNNHTQSATEFRPVENDLNLAEARA